MSKKSVEINLCDICEFNDKKVLELVAVNTCEVCERDYCANKHVADSYYTTQHMRDPLERTICKECWGLLDHNGYKNSTTPLPTGKISLHASGSSSAINIAEFRDNIEEHARSYAQDAVVRVLKATRAGVVEKLDIEQATRQIKSKQEKELTELLQKKYDEART